MVAKWAGILKTIPVYKSNAGVHVQLTHLMVREHCVVCTARLQL